MNYITLSVPRGSDAMITFRFSTDVNEDRRVELTLPAEVPTGKADLVISVHSRTLPPKRPRTSLAEWAERSAEHWADRLDSTDTATFTGRRF